MRTSSVRVRIPSFLLLLAWLIFFAWCVMITFLTLDGHSATLPIDPYNNQILMSEIRTLQDSVIKLNKALIKSNSRVTTLQEQMVGVMYKGVLAFLHIGKVGGTSFDKVGEAIAKEKQYSYEGKHHFDWSEIDKVKAWKNNLPVEVVTLLREPVDRAVSHFYFRKSQAFQEDSKMLNQTLSEYLFEGNKKNLLNTRDIWQDGQAGVSWLTGTHIVSWAVPGITKEMVTIREYKSQSTTTMLPLAAARLRETKWFGLLEDLNRSMVLLQHAFNLSEVPSMPTKNQNHIEKLPVAEQEHDALASLMPQDIWLYEYAKVLFEARWKAFQTGVLVEPPEPPLPKVLPCKSTRFKLRCNSGPLAQFYSH